MDPAAPLSDTDSQAPGVSQAHGVPPLAVLAVPGGLAEGQAAPLPTIWNLSRGELTEWVKTEREQPFRADQIRKWLFGKRVDSFEAMTDVPAGLRARLAESYSIFSSQLLSHQKSTDGTEKLLLEMVGGDAVECVLMREEDRRTICISTQVGCGMGCVFCASGMMGFQRNLSAGEILEQIARLDRLLPADERITNVVVMGMGEPLANLKNLIKALDSIDEKGGLGLGARRITVSTVGLPEKIAELAEIGRQYNLAISLHAPTDALRSSLVRINEKVGIEKLMAAADGFFATTGRRVTFEYVVLSEVNDGPEQAEELAALLGARQSHLNLIPMNSVSELPYQDPSGNRLHKFVDLLRERGLNVTVRKRKGADIDAACGQLRLRHEQARLATAGVPQVSAGVD
jgi:23S rRNA (adenine2503-C2)-methyltransferase